MAAAFCDSGTASVAMLRFCGVNFIETPQALLGSERAARSLRRLSEIGANCVALVPFLWQSRPDDCDVVWGSAVPPERLAMGIRQAKAAGLHVMLKPHIWIPGHWAGQVAMKSESEWQRWMTSYQSHMVMLAHLAAEHEVDALFIGTELRLTSQRGEWRDIIAAVRNQYHGIVSYVAHGPEEAEKIEFWDQLDAVAASLYPSLGNAHDRRSWEAAMTDTATRLQGVARNSGKPCWIGEMGIRSAKGATSKPWESPEERRAMADPALQAAVIDAWLDVAQRMGIETALVWRWFSDPDGGGATDTDFTVQNKPAEAVLQRRWVKT